MFLLNVTGDEGESSSHIDLDGVQHEVENLVREWLSDEHRGDFGFGDGTFRCEQHADAESVGGCNDCLDAETDAAEGEIATHVSNEISGWMHELTDSGYLVVTAGEGDRLSFRLNEA